jgi:streptogramin lyase
VGEGFAWVTCTGKDNPCSGPSVLKLDPRSGKTLATISLPEHPFAIATGLGAVWVTMYEGLAKLDPVEERVSAVFQGNYSQVGTAGGSVWTTSKDPDRVYRIDPTTGAVLNYLDLGSSCTFEASRDVVWVATCDAEIRSDGGEETLAKIDAHTAEVVLQAPLASYGQMRMAGESLWVASQVERRSDVIEVIRLDPETGKVAGEPIRITSGRPRFFAHGEGLPHVFVAADQGSLWLTDFGAGEVIRLMLPPTEASSRVVESSPFPTQTEATTPTPYRPTPSPAPASGVGVSVPEATLDASHIEGLPEGFPSSFPFPQGTTSCGAHAIEEQGGTLFETCFRVAAIYDEVVRFYRRNLPEKDWTLGPIPHGSEGSRIAAFEVAGHGFVGRLEVVEEPGRVTLYVELES